MIALLVIDLQNDFCPGGALATQDGHAIVGTVNELVKRFPIVVQTQDWHPEGHISFASSHEGRAPFETIETPYGEQVLWPDHCVPGTDGAAFHPELDTTQTQLVIRKGFRPEIDSYSAFRENDRDTQTGLHGYLQERGVEEIVVCGLATDYCVKWSALDARDLGYQVTVVEDAVSGVDDDTVAQALEAFAEAGVRVASAPDLGG